MTPKTPVPPTPPPTRGGSVAEIKVTPKAMKVTQVRRAAKPRKARRKPAVPRRPRALGAVMAHVLRRAGPLTPAQRRVVEGYCERAVEGAVLFSRKHQDYGPGNVAEGGGLGVLLRISEKVQRLMSLRGRGAKNETKKDSAADIHVLAGMLLMVMDGAWPSVTTDPTLAI